LENYSTSTPINISRTVRAGLWLAWLAAMILMTLFFLLDKRPASGIELALMQMIPNFYVLFLLVWILPGTILWLVLKVSEGISFGLSVGVGFLASLMGFVVGLPFFFMIFYTWAYLSYAFTN